MGTDISEYRTMSINEAGYDEGWLQNAICESPNILNLGDLRLVSREKIVSSGGRLDVLLQDIEAEDMYEVEVQLGDTDPSHIIRTIEYWDLIRKKYPQRQHFAVLIAESITKRFFNVISLLSANIPIIAIQCQIIEIAGNKALVFTKILDTYEEPEEIQLDSNIIVDEKYWISRATNILTIAKKIFVATKEIYKGATLEYNKYSIVIKMNMFNMIKFHKKSGNFMFVELKYGNFKKEIFELFESNGILPIDKYAQARFTISSDELTEKIELITEIAKLNVNWWKTEDA